MTHSKRNAAIAIPITLVLLAVVLLLTSNGPKAADAPDGPAPSSAAERSDALSKFAILADKAKTPSDAAKVAKSISLPGQSLDPAGVRLARAKDPTIHVLGTDSRICLKVIEANGTGMGGCSDPAKVDGRDGLTGAVSKLHEGQRLTLLVPDGVTGLAVTQDGERSALDVLNNVATKVVSDSPGTIEWINDVGKRVTQPMAGADQG